jgi:hypothetical protein
MSSCSGLRRFILAAVVTAVAVQKRRTFYPPRNRYTAIHLISRLLEGQSYLIQNEADCASWPISWLIVRKPSRATSVSQLNPIPSGPL